MYLVFKKGMCVMSSDEMKEILIQYRKSQGLSQKELAARCNLTQSTISTMENGDFYPSMYSFLTICDGLSITPSQFFLSSSENTVVLNEEARSLIDLWNSLNGDSKNLALSILHCIKKAQHPASDDKNAETTDDE